MKKKKKRKITEHHIEELWDNLKWYKFHLWNLWKWYFIPFLWYKIYITRIPARGVKENGTGEMFKVMT